MAVDTRGFLIPGMGRNLSHIFASDIDASLAFYTKWFGARVIWDGIFAGARNVFAQIGGGRLHFYDQPPQGNGKNTFHYLGIQVDDLDALYLRMNEGGFPLNQPVKRFSEGAYLMVEAPDGYCLNSLKHLLRSGRSSMDPIFFK